MMISTRHLTSANNQLSRAISTRTIKFTAGIDLQKQGTKAQSVIGVSFINVTRYNKVVSRCMDMSNKNVFSDKQ